MEWIKVSDRLPEYENENIIIHGRGWENNGSFVSFGFYENKTFIDFDGDDFPNVTHWQPLPEPPK